MDVQDQGEGHPESLGKHPGFDYADAIHDGYQRLNDPVTHRRRICFIKPHFWLVLDELSGKQSHTYDQYFHFAANADSKSAIAWRQRPRIQTAPAYS